MQTTPSRMQHSYNTRVALVAHGNNPKHPFRTATDLQGKPQAHEAYALSFCMGKQCCRPHAQERMQHSYNTRVALVAHGNNQKHPFRTATDLHGKPQAHEAYALSFCMGKQCCRPHPQERMQHSYNTRVAWLPVWGELGPDPCLEGREGQMPDLHVLSQHLTSLTTDPSTGCCHQW